LLSPLMCNIHIARLCRETTSLEQLFHFSCLLNIFTTQEQHIWATIHVWATIQLLTPKGRCSAEILWFIVTARKLMTLWIFLSGHLIGRIHFSKTVVYFKKVSCSSLRSRLNNQYNV
jgi:hypothetical protein